MDCTQWKTLCWRRPERKAARYRDWPNIGLAQFRQCPGRLLDGAEQDLAKVLVHEALISRLRERRSFVAGLPLDQDAETRTRPHAEDRRFATASLQSGRLVWGKQAGLVALHKTSLWSN